MNTVPIDACLHAWLGRWFAYDIGLAADDRLQPIRNDGETKQADLCGNVELHGQIDVRLLSGFATCGRSEKRQALNAETAEIGFMRTQSS